MSWATKAVERVPECGLLHWWFLFKNTLSSKYWLVRDCRVIWVAQGNSLTYFIYWMFIFLKLWIKKNNQTQQKKTLASILDSFSCSESLPAVGIVAAMICLFSFDTDFAFYF